MKKILLSMIAAVCLSASAFAQAHSDRISLGVGLLCGEQDEHSL